jgi:hypothetical protein
MNDRCSVNAFFSIAAEQDVEVEDELARGLLLFMSGSLIISLTF